MYKNIIPDLVSMDTKLKGANGFIMCQNFDFFRKVNRPNKFHYKMILGKVASSPKDYDFRSEYFVKKDKSWYFDRKIFLWQPAFRYDFANKIFYFNRAYFNLPFKIGGIFTVGEHVSNMIDLDLFLNGYVCLRGIAVKLNNKNIGISGPGFNGKTTLLKKLLKNGARYIAEDYLVLDLKNRKVYPTCPLAKENFWRRRKITNELTTLIKSQEIINEEQSLDKLYFIQNSENINYNPGKKEFIDFVLLNSLYFLNNLFIRSYIYEQNLTKLFFKRIDDIKKLNFGEFIKINNFNFNFLENFNKDALKRK